MSLLAGKTAGHRTRRILRRLAVSAPFDLEEFRECLERRSGRPVHLIPAALPAGSPSGVCIRTAGQDYLYFEQRTSPFHQAHIQVNLAAHILLTEVIQTWLWQPPDRGGLGALAESAWDVALLRAEVVANWRHDPGRCSAEGRSAR